MIFHIPQGRPSQTIRTATGIRHTDCRLVLHALPCPLHLQPGDAFGFSYVRAELLVRHMCRPPFPFVTFERRGFISQFLSSLRPSLLAVPTYEIGNFCFAGFIGPAVRRFPFPVTSGHVRAFLTQVFAHFHIARDACDMQCRSPVQHWMGPIHPGLPLLDQILYFG